MRRCLVLAVLVSICPLAFAQAYKWKDAQGITHYADSPPAGQKYERIKTSGTAEAPAPASTAPKQPTAAATASGRDDTPENRKKLCDQLQKNTQILKTEKVVSMDDGKGGVKAIDDAARQAEMKRIEAQQTLYCQG